jgi:methylamine--corrinoid protein Co-methyltransferase
MASLVKLVEMLQRAKDGPACSVREWEIKVIPQTVKKYLKKYDLEDTFNKEVPVNQDLALADRFFEAGLELAAEIGLLCIDTETMIKVSKDEILQAMEDAPDHLILGESTDRVVLKTRQPEDKNPPIFAAPLSIQVDEDLYVPIAEGILKSKKVHVHQGPSLDTVFAKPVYAGTPFETVVAFRENRLRKEAQWRAGRVGISNMSIASSCTEYGQLSGFAGQSTKNNPSIAIILSPSELKTCYASFHKAAVAIGYGGHFISGSPAMIGGYSGGAEGAALADIACDLLQFPIMQASLSACQIYDVRFDSTCGRHALWAMSIACQALSRNTHTLQDKIINQCAGPCTEEILYTSAAGLIAAGVSGLPFTVGVRSAGGKYKNYLTPLEHWFGAEVFEASSKLSLEEANELVLYLLSKYEAGLKNQPKGKSFTECFDINTLTPNKEWQEIHDRVQADIQAHGLALD